MSRVTQQPDDQHSFALRRIAQLNQHLASFRTPVTVAQYESLCAEHGSDTVDRLIEYAVTHNFRHTTSRMIDDAITGYPPLHAAIDVRIEFETLAEVARRGA